MASLPPEEATDFTPEQISALYPKDLTLQHVQIFFRHGVPQRVISSNVFIGERTPTHHRLVAAGIPAFWNVCKAADEFRETTLLSTGIFQSLHYRRKVENPDSNGRLQNVNRAGERSW